MDKPQQYNTGHPHAAPNFRNLIIKPMWMTMKTALRTVPFLGRLGLLKNNYHGQEVTMTDDFTQSRIGGGHLSEGHTYAADRESTDLLPFLERPVTCLLYTSPSPRD